MTVELWQIVLALILLVLAGIIFNYINKTRKKTGPLLSQAYLSLTEEEKQYFDKDKEYERITVLYGLFAFFFVFVAIAVITLNKIVAYIGIGILIVAFIYTITKMIEMGIKK